MHYGTGRSGVEHAWSLRPVGGTMGLSHSRKEVHVLLKPFRQHRDQTAAARARPTDAPRTIVVGVDRSDESRAAFSAAMERAGPGDTVAVIHARPPVADWLGSPYAQRRLEDRLLEGERTLDEFRGAGTWEASASFEQHEGRPAEVLARIGALRDADEIVVGARRLGRLRALVSSVSRALLRSANRPVVVVPHRSTAT
jgi:nucleotide-binding universal stress UspA family protein